MVDRPEDLLGPEEYLLEFPLWKKPRLEERSRDMVFRLITDLEILLEDVLSNVKLPELLEKLPDLPLDLLTSARVIPDRPALRVNPEAFERPVETLLASIRLLVILEVFLPVLILFWSVLTRLIFPEVRSARVLLFLPIVLPLAMA